MTSSGNETEAPYSNVSTTGLAHLLQGLEAEAKRTADFNEELIANGSNQLKEKRERDVIFDYSKVNAVLARWAEQVDLIAANHLCPVEGAAPLLLSNKRARTDTDGDDEGRARKSRK